jgi:hypothetical protein
VSKHLQTLRDGYRRDHARGAHGERGVRIYLTAADLVELRDLIAHASPRLTRKVADASERIERG